MANKQLGEPRMYQEVERLLRDGLDNVKIRDQIKKKFPELRTGLIQIASFRYELRRKDQSIPTSLEARYGRKIEDPSLYLERRSRTPQR